MDMNEFIDAVIEKLSELGVKCLRIDDVRDAMVEVIEELEGGDEDAVRRSA